MSARLPEECNCKPCKASRRRYDAAVRHGHPLGTRCEKCRKEGIK